MVNGASGVPAGRPGGASASDLEPRATPSIPDLDSVRPATLYSSTEHQGLPFALTGVEPVGQAAARVGDLIKQDAPHCHATIHPPAPVPTPVPHPALPLPIVKGAATVVFGGQPAARVTDLSSPCILPACVPAGPGMIAKGSTSVLVEGLPAARVNDPTSHPSCVAPIPSPVGKVLPPGCPTVLIGG